MQILRTLRPDESIFFIICGCLFTSVARKLLRASSSFLSPLSILQTTNSSSKGSGEDQGNTGNVPRRSTAEGNQFFPNDPDEDQCNCADFVPIDRSPSSIGKSLIAGFKLFTRLLEEIVKVILKTIENILLTIVVHTYKSLHSYCDVSTPIDTIESLRNFLNKPSNNRINLEMNDSNDQSDCNIEETANERSSDDTSSTNTISFQEYISKFLSGDIDRSKEEFGDEGTTKKNSLEDARNQREKCTEDTDGRKNDDITGTDDVLPSHKFVSGSKIATRDADDNSRSSTMKINENAKRLLIRSLAEMFLASILSESDVFGAQREQPEEGHSIEEEKKADNELSLHDDESRSKILAVKFEKHLTLAEESDKICSAMEDDYPGKQSGMLPEKGVNSLEEESGMHSSKEVTQFRAEETEKGEDVGPPPDARPANNSGESESAGFSDSPPVSDRGREEEDLNAIVRRMIIIELKKHRKKERIVLKRAHSDSETVIPRKRQHAKSRTGLFNLKGRTFFRDLLELDESLRKNSENESCVSVKIDFGERGTKRKESMDQNEISSGNNVNVSVTTDSTNVAENSVGTACTIDSNIKLGRKTDLPCMLNIDIDDQSTDPEKIPETVDQTQECKYTQTERVYVIRAVRSCPLRKRRVALQLQLHCSTDREPYFSTIVYANQDFSKFIYRKASDDLIYEKGKGSRSPGYVPVPERFRWKYLMPNKVR